VSLSWVQWYGEEKKEKKREKKRGKEKERGKEEEIWPLVNSTAMNATNLVDGLPCVCLGCNGMGKRRRRENRREEERRKERKRERGGKGRRRGERSYGPL
jgi:hypothetical protein